jgi:DMSO/TMAO reductase YedYZ molybdopterin-dependent catalytic subunit
VQGRPEAIRFERSLELENAVLDDTLLAYAMNGEALPRQHGFPLRLVVPGWYGVASVKWLTAIELVEEPFRGHYQVDKYWYEWERRGSLVREPVTRQRVRALITEPGDNAIVQRGELAIRGVAWSGKAPIARVEVGIGDDWREARLVGEARSHAWQWWELITHLDAPGIVNLSARATDVDGMTQPERAEWNRLGYGNNSIQRLTITIA